MMAIETNADMRHPDAAGIGNALEEILHSSQFKDALQLQSLLKYIVENSIRGHDDALKERIIGINVFGRKPDYETADDPIVRSRVGQLRRRLEQYYQSREANGTPVQVVIPNGSYRPAFILRPGANGANAVHSAFDPPLRPRPGGAEGLLELKTPSNPGKLSRKDHWRTTTIGAAIACAILFASWLATANWRKSEFDLFWEPLLETNKKVLIYTGPGWVYVPSASFEQRFRTTDSLDDQKLPMGKWGPPELADGQVLTAKDLVLDKFDYSGSGELVACAKLAVLLTSRHRTFDLRSDDNLPFADIRNSPAVLLGAYNNFWTMETTKDLPFFYDRDVRIRERGGQGRVWSIVRRPGVPPQEEYLLVTRHFDANTGSPLISVSGITTCGTRAAADFVTDPEQLKKLAAIPRDALEHKSLAIVLHSTFVDCTPTSTDVLAIRYW